MSGSMMRSDRLQSKTVNVSRGSSGTLAARQDHEACGEISESTEVRRPGVRTRRIKTYPWSALG